jgi:hypothetical protein
MRTIGTEFRISLNELGVVIRSPEAVTAPDGSVLLADYGMDAFSGGFVLRVIRTDPDTGAQTALLRLPIADLGFQGFNRGFDGADIAVRADGSFAVAFTGYDFAFTGGRSVVNSALYVQTFSADGTATGGPRELERWDNGIGGNSVRDVRLETSGNGYTLAYSMNDSANAEQLYALRLGANGAAVAPAETLAARGKPDMLALPFGDMLLAWNRGGTIMTQVVKADGSVEPARTLPGLAWFGSSTDANDVELRRLPDGRIFALFESSASEGQAGLHLQQLDETGAAIGESRLAVPTRTSAGTVTFAQSSPEARARFDLLGLPDGLMVLAYAFALVAPDPRDRDFDIGVTLLLPDGTPLQSDPILLTGNLEREQSSPYLLRQADGTILLAFYDQRPATFGGRNEMRAVEIALPERLQIGTEGNDLLRGGALDDQLYGLAGNDTLLGEAGNDTLDGGPGNDRLEGGYGDDSLSGGDGNDFLLGGPDNDTLLTGAGNDTVWAGPGDDTVIAASGNNEVWSGLGNDSLTGGTGNDTLGAGGGDDLIDARAGGVNQLWAGAGRDTVYGANGGDQIGGAAGDDLVYAGSGADAIYLGAGNDQAYGGAGDDTIFAGPGFDRMWGGAGADRFEFYRSYGWNRVEDLAADDVLALARGLWTGTAGTLTAAQVVTRFGSVNAAGDAVLNFGTAADTTIVIVGAGTLDGLADQILIL